jgi:hypothetical protein
MARSVINAPRQRARGAQQNSGGKVFPTEQNSGLRGPALRHEQEEWFGRGLSQGKIADQLRGQAHEAGVRRYKQEILLDPDVEAALRRAELKAKK